MPRPCLFNLHPYCIVYETLVKYHRDQKKLFDDKWGSPEWVKIYCAMCMKAAYAKAKNSIRVVNTL